MINNIIFLDIDGVLNSNKYFDSISNKECMNLVDRLTLDIDVSKVKILLEVINKTNAKIVITSSWRRMKLYPYIKERLISMGLPVVGETPFIKGRRGEEIRSYLLENRVSNYCIIDDEVFKDYKELEDYLVVTDFYEDGLTIDHAKGVVKKLIKKEEM